MEISDDGDEMEEGRVAEFAAIPGGRIKVRSFAHLLHFADILSAGFTPIV